MANLPSLSFGILKVTFYFIQSFLNLSFLKKIDFKFGEFHQIYQDLPTTNEITILRYLNYLIEKYSDVNHFLK